MTRLPRLASAAADCSSSVDLPMPGSPPTSSADPFTTPPPVTRPTSAMPVTTRAAFSVSPDSGTRFVGRPPALADFGPAPTPESAISSTMVFHSPQASHRPCQRVVTAPQAWQTNEDRDLAIGYSAWMLSHV